MSAIEQPEGSVTSEVDMHVLSISECFVYKVPPLRSASGHRAEDWGLENPLFTGCIKIFQTDSKLRIMIFKYTDQTKLSMSDENIVFFGECPVVVKPGENVTNFVDAVIDSSRYYVCRIKDPRSERTTLIGVGFRERDHAFDFKSSLNEYVKYIDRMHKAERLRAGSVESDGSEERHSLDGESSPVQHLDDHIAPLKEGEKIKVQIKLHRKDKGALTLQAPDSHAHRVPSARLPPPSSCAVTAALETHSMIRPPSFRLEGQDHSLETPQGNGEEDWGDFTSSA